MSAGRIGALLGKDLRILGRSRALLVALVLYPLLVALLVGLVARFASDRPRVGFVDLDGIPAEVVVGGQRFDVNEVIDRVETEVELVPMSEDEADRRLRTGDIVGAIIVPRGFVSNLRSLVRQPELVLRTSRGGLAGRVERQTEALVYNLNRELQDAYIEANLDYVRVLQEGGTGDFLGNEFTIVGLAGAERLLAQLRDRNDDPASAEDIAELETFVAEAKLALDQTGLALRATANPITLRLDDEGRRSSLLSAQVQAYALALTMRSSASSSPRARSPRSGTRMCSPGSCAASCGSASWSWRRSRSSWSSVSRWGRRSPACSSRCSPSRARPRSRRGCGCRCSSSGSR